MKIYNSKENKMHALFDNNLHINNHCKNYFIFEFLTRNVQLELWKTLWHH